jgi:hypothetical protein
MTAFRAWRRQVKCQAVNSARDVAEARAVMQQSIARLRQQIRAGV